MKKIILFAFAAVALLAVSCNKQELAQPSENDNSVKSGLVIKVTVPKTKMAYTDEGASGLDFTLTNAKDRLIAYFRNSEGTMIGEAVPMNLDPSTLAGDKKSGTFKAASDVEIPAEATSIFFYLDNEDNGLYSLTGASIDWLNNQAGTLEDVAKHQVIVGSVDVAALTPDVNGDMTGTITLAYKTSVLKLEITFPDGVVPTDDGTTTITVSDDNVYNKVHVAWGEPHLTASNNAKGAIVTHPVSVLGQVATAYITVWGTSVFDGATITGVVGGYSCSTTFTAGGTLLPGKIYSVPRTLNSPNLLSKWVNDDATDIDFVSGLTVDTPVAWMTYNSGTGKISLAANETGTPRSGELTFTNGSSVEITQLEVKDFKGTWTVNSKKFNKSGGTGSVATTNNDNTDVVFGDPYKAAAADGKTNNIGITGLFDNYVLDATVDINYSAKTCNFSLFFDGSTAQALSTPLAGYNYVVALPGLGHSFVGGAYNFIPSPITDDHNYLRVSFTSESFDKVSFKKGTTRYYVTHNSDDKFMVIAISFALANQASVSSASDLYSSYSRVYQANPNNNVDVGLSFTRK